VVALVQCLEPEKAGWGLGGSSGAFALPEDHWGVVRARVDGAFAEIEGMDEHILVGKGRHELEAVPECMYIIVSLPSMYEDACRYARLCRTAGVS
jgi:hypothetical protein